MLGVSLFRLSKGIDPISFDYEIRKLGYAQFDNGWYIAGGDKAGSLKVLKYDGKEIIAIGNKSFGFKIIDIEFIIYGKDEKKLGLMVALEKTSEPNIYFYPDVRTRPLYDKSWNTIRHGHDVPRLVFQPYVNDTEKITKTVFSFQGGDFIIGDLIPDENQEQVYLIEKSWHYSFTSRIMDACVEFPANIKQSRRENKQKNEVMYIASRGGDIWLFEINPGTKITPSLEPHKVKTISNSIQAIIPIHRISREEGDITGVFGIAGSEFFILYCKQEDKLFPEKYKLQKERFQDTLHSIAVGAFRNPDEEKEVYNKVIFLGDSKKVIHARQFQDRLEYDNVTDVLFENRRIFSENLGDRVLDMIPIDYVSQNGKDSVLYQLVLGMGDHRIVFKDLLDWNYVLDKINRDLLKYIGTESRTTGKPLEIEQYINMAREFEYNHTKKCKLIAAIFYHKPSKKQLALKFLEEGRLNAFIQLMYWLLSEANRPIYNLLHKLICELIQKYKEIDPNRAESKPIYTSLNRLLEDIEKFWIGGETYSKKKGNILDLIERNTKNEKVLDKTIYQAILNDRGYSLECQIKVSNHEIQSICQVGDVLFAVDNGGNIHLLNIDDLSKIGPKTNILAHSEKIYGPNYRQISELDKNFVRRIAALPGCTWGAMLLRTGGIQIFHVDKIFQVKVLKDVMFNDPGSFLIAEDIMPYSIKHDKPEKNVYVGDRFGCLYRLEFDKFAPSSLKRLYPSQKPNIYNPIWDFDFLEDGRIIFGDRLGNVTWVSKDGICHKNISFPTAPAFTSCLVCENDTVILGTEEGDIIALDYSGEEPECIWTYNLPGAIRFIKKTDDEKLLIGGMCGKAALINLSGKIEDHFDFERYTRHYEIHPVLINRLSPLKLITPKYDEQRLVCITGDDKGVLRIYRLFKSKIYEEEIQNYFFSGSDIDEKIKMRCINIRDNTLRRLYTSFESKSKKLDFDRTREEIAHIAHTRSYHYLIGPLLFLVPNLIDKFIRKFKNRVEKESLFQTYYNDLQNTAILLSSSWGIEKDVSCQQLMKALGVGLISIMTYKNLYLKIEEAVKSGKITNMRSLFELLENVHIHSLDSSLIDMYEEIRSSLDKRKDVPYFDAVIQFICLRFRGRTFDKLMPHPLLLKKVELLAFIADRFKFCPIKLCYRLFEYDADTDIFHHLTYKVSDRKNKRVFDAAYYLDLKLQSYRNISMELDIISHFNEIFPEEFSGNDAGFYSEFSFVFGSIRKIQNFSDAMNITLSERLPKYRENAEWFPNTIGFLNPLIDKVSQMKEIFEKILDPSREELIPRRRLIELREELKKMSETLEERKIGRLYSSLIENSIDHIDEILTFFCEVTLPIQTIESTATSLENYLDEIRTKDKPLRAIDNPETITLYNRFFREMFDAVIVGLNSQYAYFQCKADVDSEEAKITDFYHWHEQYSETQSSNEMQRRMEQAEKQSRFSKPFLLYLPDFDHYYGQYWVGFLKENEQDSSIQAKISRYEELVRILNLYIMAFNGIVEAELQSRFSHRLFAHQTKEPILTIKRQLELLTGDKFKDPDRSKTRDYHDRMLRIATQMLKRSENILNANKRSLNVELELSQFDLYATVEDVVKSMRKVKDSNTIPGEISFTRPPGVFIVNSDENKIREILEQLIYNSLKYCRDTRKIRVTVGHDSNLFHLDVIDNGFGILDHEMPYIFRRFFRGDDSMKYSIDGDGLGLWVVKSYIDRLGGDIHAVNIKNEYKRIRGIRFSVKIPITAPKKIEEEMNE